MLNLTDTPHFVPATTQPKQIILLLHGVGADGYDLFELQPIFSQALPQAIIVSPHGFDPYDHAPFGRQWFKLGDMTHEHINKVLPNAAQRLSTYIKELLEHFNMPPTKLAIVGFSQGAMLGLHYALSIREPIGSMVACSGALIAPPSWQDIPHHLRTPIAITHGTLDNVVPITKYREALNILQNAKWPVQELELPHLEHGIDYETINFAIKHLSI